jgi:hypothetical protein
MCIFMHRSIYWFINGPLRWIHSIFFYIRNLQNNSNETYFSFPRYLFHNAVCYLSILLSIFFTWNHFKMNIFISKVFYIVGFKYNGSYHRPAKSSFSFELFGDGIWVPWFYDKVISPYYVFTKFYHIN